MSRIRKVVAPETQTKYPRKQYVPPTPQESMLTDFLNAKTPQEKRNLLAKFNTLLYIFDKEKPNANDPS